MGAACSTGWFELIDQLELRCQLQLSLSTRPNTMAMAGMSIGWTTLPIGQHVYLDPEGQRTCLLTCPSGRKNWWGISLAQR